MFINLFPVLFQIGLVCAILYGVFFAKDKLKTFAVIIACMGLYLLAAPEVSKFTNDITSASDESFNSVGSLVEDILNSTIVNNN